MTPRSSTLRRAFVAAAALFAALMVSACTTTTTGAGDPPRNAAFAPATVDARAAAAMISAIRARNGLGPVTVDADLMSRAVNQANAMARAGVMSHTVDGDFQRRMRGRLNSAAAENIGAGYTSLEAVMASWTASPGHYSNLLLPGATNIGIAVAFNPNSTYGNFFALILAGPN
ncbi:MAG: CAP domain-containing protein [Bauldia sp.]